MSTNSSPSQPKRPKTAAGGDATTTTHWIAPDLKDDSVDRLSEIECLCVGTGRFLRAVLMPILQQSHAATALVQPRGRSFLEFMQQQQQTNKYPVDTVLRTGEVETEYISCAAAFSWGQEQDKQAFYECLPRIVIDSGDKKKNGISILGLGVTEAGLASCETQVMKDVYRLFEALRDLDPQVDTPPPNGKICVIDMDNVPNNGSTIQKHMLTLADKQDKEDDQDKKMSMKRFLTERVAFLNTMVDRITSQRKDSPMIPRAEPVPAKALVVCDPDGYLPSWFTALSTGDDQAKYGLVIRSTAAQLETDVALKLRIANGTHTAIAHVMALLKLPMTDALSPSSPATVTSTLLMDYLDSLAKDQILVAASAFVASNTGVNDEMAWEQATAVWQDWRQRLTHPHFGLSTFFITQNGPAKGGIRLTPTIVDLVQNCNNNNEEKTTGIHVSMAFCFAVLLRWLTPSPTPISNAPPTPDGVFTGWFPKNSIQGSDDANKSEESTSSTTTVTYADGLQYNFDQGWYQFRCNCQIVGDDGDVESQNLSELLLARLMRGSPSKQPSVFVDVIRAYLVAPTGGNQASIKDTKAFATFSQAVTALYSRMVAGDSSSLLAMLQEMKDCKSPYKNGFASDCAVLVNQK